MQFGQLTTEGGYLNSECTSAMQKCIRRGLEEEALFWATELDFAGYGAYVWRRLQIIASEDIGLADLHTAAGRSAMRGIDHFFKVGAAIKNPVRSLLPDPFEKRAWPARRTVGYGHEEPDLGE